MTKLQQVNKIVIKMLNKHENQRMESRNVAIDRKFTKNIPKTNNQSPGSQKIPWKRQPLHRIVCCYLLKMLYEKKISEIIRLIYGGKVLGKKYVKKLRGKNL